MTKTIHVHSEKELSIVKRIIANIIDIIAMYIFWIWLIINLFLYYKHWETLWLKIFNSHIIDKSTKLPPKNKSLIIRFFIKYLWMLLLFMLFSALSKLLLGWLYLISPSSEWNTSLISFFVFILPLVLFISYIVRDFKKQKKFIREKRTNTITIIKK